MDEEITIIDTKTRNEKIKVFLIKNKRILISIIAFLIILILSIYSYQIYKGVHKEGISEKYNNAVLEYENGDKFKSVTLMKEVIEDRDNTYSPLALYFLIDNNLIEDKNEINVLFDLIIKKTSLELEIKNLIIYKKALYNADEINENELLEILNPLLKSESIWRSHALYLVAEYYYSKDQKQKSKEFFSKILSIENSNQDIKIKAQRRLNRDLSE